MIAIEIDLRQIPSDKVREYAYGEGQLGAAVHLNVTKMKQPDRFGKTHTVYISQSREEKQAGVPKIYVGKGTEIDYNSTPADNPIKRRSTEDDEPF